MNSKHEGSRIAPRQAIPIAIASTYIQSNYASPSASFCGSATSPPSASCILTPILVHVSNSCEKIRPASCLLARNFKYCAWPSGKFVCRSSNSKISIGRTVYRSQKILRDVVEVRERNVRRKTVGRTIGPIDPTCRLYVSATMLTNDEGTTTNTKEFTADNCEAAQPYNHPDVPGIHIRLRRSSCSTSRSNLFE